MTIHANCGEAETFWWLTQIAHLQSALHALARAYDQENSSLSLRAWLETIREHAHFFSEENFRERLKDNPFVASLATTARIPDADQLDRDIAYCSMSNQFVQSLVRVRNNALAHRGFKLAARGRSVFEDVDLSHDALDELIKTGFEIYNHYNQLFRATSLSRQMLGHDDLQHVLDTLRADLARREQEIDEEIRRDGALP